MAQCLLATECTEMVGSGHQLFKSRAVITIINPEMLKTEAEYEEALADIYLLMVDYPDCEKDSPEGIELDRLATLIEYMRTNIIP